MSEEIKNGIVPKLRFLEFGESGDWNQKALGAMTEKVGSGSTPLGGEAKYKKSGRPFVRSQNVGWGIFLVDDIAFIDEETHQESISTEINKEDILLNITGASIGRAVVADSFVSGGNVNQHVCIIRTVKKVLNPFFLNQYLISNNGQKQIDSFQAGGNRQGLNFPQIRSFLIPIPPNKEEQQKIADCLSSLDELITAESQKLEAFKTHKKGLMQQLFPAEGETVPKLRFAEFRDDGDWEDWKLGNLVEIKSGTSPSNYTLSSEGNYPFLKVEDLNNCEKYQIKSREYSGDKNTVIPKKSVIFPKRGFAILSNKVRINIDEVLMDTNLMAITPNEKIETEFLYYKILFEGLYKIADTSTIPQINNKHIIPYDILMPSKKEQQKIADCLSSLDELITAQTEKIATLKMHKKGLMQGLFPSLETETY